MTPNDETGSFMATKVTPPIAVAATNMYSNITLPELVNYLTVLYLALMISHKGWRMYREWRSGKEGADEPGE